MPRDALLGIVDGFAGKRIVVLGDAMLDEFVWGAVRRISPEAPVPVVEVEKETYRPGGCANAAANIKALGGQPITIGVVGIDDAGKRLRGLLEDLDVGAELLVDDEQRRTTLKTRIVAHGQQVVRADKEDRGRLGSAVIERLCERAVAALAGSDALVVSDYNKGVVNAEVLGRVLPHARKSGIPVILDPKVYDADYYHPITIITPNHREAELMSGIAIGDRDTMEAAGRVLLRRFDCPYILITLGEKGMVLVDESGIHEIPPTAHEVFDVSGAGDTVIATLGLAQSSGATMEQSARLANFAAGVVVGKLGTATLTDDELRRAVESRPLGE